MEVKTIEQNKTIKQNAINPKSINPDVGDKLIQRIAYVESNRLSITEMSKQRKKYFYLEFFTRNSLYGSTTFCVRPKPWKELTLDEKERILEMGDGYLEEIKLEVESVREMEKNKNSIKNNKNDKEKIYGKIKKLLVELISELHYENLVLSDYLIPEGGLKLFLVLKGAGIIRKEKGSYIKEKDFQELFTNYLNNTEYFGSVICFKHITAWRFKQIMKMYKNKKLREKYKREEGIKLFVQQLKQKSNTIEENSLCWEMKKLSIAKKMGWV